jgi:hypothetical protein
MMLCKVHSENGSRVYLNITRENLIRVYEVSCEKTVNSCIELMRGEMCDEYLCRETLDEIVGMLSQVTINEL